MESRGFNGKEYLDLIRSRKEAGEIMSLLIENGALDRSLFGKNDGKESKKVENAIRLLEDGNYLQQLFLGERTILILTPACLRRSQRALLGETPGRRAHRFPEAWMFNMLIKDPFSLACGLLRGRFLMEWREKRMEEMADYPAEKCKVLFPPERGPFGGIKICPPAGVSDLKIRWILFSPQEKENILVPEEREAGVSEWVSRIAPEDSIFCVQEQGSQLFMKSLR